MRKNLATQKSLIRRLTCSHQEWKEMGKTQKSVFLKNKAKNLSMMSNSSFEYGLNVLSPEAQR